MQGNRVRLQIGIISTRIYPDRGGPANQIYTISLKQSSFGHHVDIITTTPDKTLPPELEPIVHLLPFRAPTPKASIISYLMFIIPYLLYTILLGIIIFSRNKVQIVHSHSPAIAGVAGVVISKILRVPHVYTVHGLVGLKLPWSPLEGSPIEYVLEKFVLNRSPSVITVSRDYNSIVQKIAPATKITTVRNGIDTDRFKPITNSSERNIVRNKLGFPANDVLLLWVGNFDIEEKVHGVVDTIHALSMLPQEQTGSWSFLLIGDGTHQEAVRSISQQTDVSNRIHFLGHRNDIFRIMSVCDIFILASHHEGSPIALLEAMSSGLVCLGSNTGGIPDIIGNSGFIFKPGDKDELSSLLSTIISKPRERELASVRARERAILELSDEHAASMITHLFISTIDENTVPK